MLLEMVQIGESISDTRRWVRYEQIAPSDDIAAAEFDQVLAAFVQHRLRPRTWPSRFALWGQHEVDAAPQ